MSGKLGQSDIHRVPPVLVAGYGASAHQGIESSMFSGYATHPIPPTTPQIAGGGNSIPDSDQGFTTNELPGSASLCGSRLGGALTKQHLIIDRQEGG
ncbi:hypothetical protein B7463_g9086, partial [Scytalidium lignicola]